MVENACLPTAADCCNETSYLPAYLPEHCLPACRSSGPMTSSLGVPVNGHEHHRLFTPKAINEFEVRRLSLYHTLEGVVQPCHTHMHLYI